MDQHTLPGKRRKKRRTLRPISPDQRKRQIEIEGNSLPALFKSGLRAMAHILKPGSCNAVGHYNCTMKVVASGDSTNRLMVDFLSKTLRLTHIHQTIFCTMHIEEFSDTKLVAQVYGVWFDRFDTAIEGIDLHGCTVKRTENGIWSSCIGYKF